MILKELKAEVLGKDIICYRRNYEQDYKLETLCTGVVVGFKTNKNDDADIKDVFIISCLIVTSENFLIEGYINNWYSASTDDKYRASFSGKQRTKRTINKILKNSIKFNDWIYYNKYNKNYVELDGKYTRYESTDDVTVGLECDFSYQYEYKKYIPTKCINKSNPDFLQQITILNRIKNDGNSIDERILMYNEYDVINYNVENYEILGYYIKHNEDDVYIPKECISENDNKDKAFDELIKKYEDSLGDSVTDDIKRILVDNFKNEYEINTLKLKNEIANIRFYNIDNTIKIITENVKDLNTKTALLYKIVNDNYATLNKKIDTVEVKLTKYVDNVKDSLQKQIDINYEKANNFRLYHVWVTNDVVAEISQSGLKNLIYNDYKDVQLSESEHAKLMSEYASRYDTGSRISNSDYYVNCGNIRKVG